MNTTKIHITLITLLMILSAGIFAQPSLLWQKTYNNTTFNNDESAVESVSDAAGNIYVLGNVRGIDGTDIGLCKFNSNGDLLWIKQYDYVFSAASELATCIAIGYDGSIYTVGYGIGLNNVSDAILLKYDTAGTQIWSRRINKTSFSDRSAIPLALDARGSVVIGCTFRYDGQTECGVIRWGFNGDSLGYTKLGDGPAVTEFYAVYSIDVDNNNNVYATGTSSRVNEERDMMIAKISSGSNLIWQKYYSGPSHLDDGGSKVRVAPDGNIVVCGSSRQNNQGSDIMVIKYGRDDGTKMWEKRYNNTQNNQDDNAGNITFDSENNIIVTGSTSKLNNGSDIITLKYSITGTSLWTKIFDTGESSSAYSIVTDNADNIYLAGRSYYAATSGYAILKYSKNGSVEWSIVTAGGSAYDIPSDIHLDPQGCVVVTGTLFNQTTNKDIAVFKYGSTIGIQQVSGEVPSKFELNQNYPNPFNPVTNIKFSIPKAGNVKLVVFDAAGREVAELVNNNLSAGSYNFDFNASHLSSGVYFYRLAGDGFTEVKKMMLVK